MHMWTYSSVVTVALQGDAGTLSSQRENSTVQGDTYATVRTFFSSTLRNSSIL